MSRPDGFLALAGRDGLFTLVLATLLAGCTLGLSMLWSMLRVVAIARATPTTVAFHELTLVPGLRLRNDTVTAEFGLRLERAAALLQGKCTSSIMLLGGITGDNGHSEASRGRDYLIARGVPAAAIILEDRSRHTLENLHHARRSIEALDRRRQRCVLVSSRSHLARCLVLARGLGLDLAPCAAEDRLPLNLSCALSLLREALLLHWYYVGRYWSLWTRSRRSLSRIS